MNNKFKNTNCLVTGVDGFSGSEIFSFLKKNKIKVAGISRNNENNFILKYNLQDSILSLSKKIKNNKIKYIIHPAAYHKLQDFKIRPKSKAQNNEKMVKNLVKLCRIHSIRNFIFFSTIDISYNNIYTKKVFYNLSKLNSENYLINQYKKGLFDKLIILRLPAIIGKKCNENFITNLIFSLKNNLAVKIWNPNNYYNNLVHIDDINLLILQLIYNDFKGKKIINCLARDPIKLIKLVNLLKKKMKSKSVFEMQKKKFFQEKKLKEQNTFRFMTVKKSLDLYLNLR